MKLLHNFRWELLGTLAGAVGGYWYWQQIGCITGTCPIKSNWQIMTPYGAVLGFLGASLLKDLTKRQLFR